MLTFGDLFPNWRFRMALAPAPDTAPAVASAEVTQPIPVFDLGDAVAEFKKTYALGLTAGAALCVRSSPAGGFRGLEKLESAKWLWRYLSERSLSSLFSEQLVATFEYALRAEAEERPGVIR